MDGRTDGKTFLSSDNTNVGSQNARFQMQQMNYVMWTCLPNIVGRFSGALGFLALLCLLIFMVVLWSTGNIGVTPIGFDVGGRCAFGCLQRLFVKRRPERKSRQGCWAEHSLHVDSCRQSFFKKSKTKIQFDLKLLPVFYLVGGFTDILVEPLVKWVDCR